MTPRKKIWFTLLGLVFGVIVGMRIQPLISGDSIYDQVKKFSEVLSTVQKYYVDDVDTPKLVESAINGMLSELDPHSVYIPAEQQKKVDEDFKGSFQGIGVEFDIIKDSITVITPIAGGPSEALGIQSGDKIVKIDGQSSIGMKRDDVPKKLRGPKGTHVVVTVVRAGIKDPMQFDITRADIPLATVDAAFVDENGTAYLELNRFAEPTYDEMMTNLDKLSQKGMKRLVLDLRGNPGGYMEKAIRIVDEFVPGGKKIVYTKSARSGEEEVYRSEDGQRYEKIPLIVLINAGSASASEIVSGAIQDLDRGLIVGETSFGKGLVQKQFMLADGSAFRLTVARYYTPSGRLIQRPYDKGREDYLRMSDRKEDAEGDNVDHVNDAKDSTKPVFKTMSGRKVFGGGGVTPDYVVRMDTVTPFTIDVFRKNVITEYIDNVLSAQGAALRSQYGGKPAEFIKSYQVTDAMFADFMAMVKKAGVVPKPGQLEADGGFLRNRLKQRIAQSLWGRTEAYQVGLQMDKQYLKALTLFPEAARISKLAAN